MREGVHGVISLHVYKFPASACAEGSVWVQSAPKTSPRASINCQAGLSSSRQEQMNQTLDGKIKPLKLLKTTQLQRAPLCCPGSPSEREREGIFLNQTGVFEPPRSHISWLAASPRGSFTPPPALSDVRLARKIPSVFNLDPHFHPPSLSPPRAPPLPAPSAGVRARQALLMLDFVGFFRLKMYVASFAPRVPPRLPAHAPAQPFPCWGCQERLCAQPAALAGSQNSQMTEGFQPRAFRIIIKKRQNICVKKKEN